MAADLTRFFADLESVIGRAAEPALLGFASRTQIAGRLAARRAAGLST